MLEIFRCARITRTGFGVANTDQEVNNMDPFHTGHMVSGDALGLQLHSSATKGNIRSLKSVLKKGINADYPNDAGQTPLFCACYANQERGAQILLSYGANPNEKSNDGTTPIHANCYNGNIRLLVTLIKAGGDLRLHDCDGKTANDWAMLQPDPNKRRKMVDFLAKSHLFAMTHGGRGTQTELSARDSNRSIIKMIKKKVSKAPAVKLDPVRRVHSMGFGRVYTGNDDHGAIVSTIPLVSEICLRHDNTGITFENGAYLVMESMTWNKSLVTVKRLHHESQPGGYIDMLITEMENMGKLRHPNILLLMGVCETNSLDNMVLVFERVSLGSLYYYLHQRLERLPTQHIRDILLQICNAILFIHNQNFIHCGLTSHAVNLVNPYIAKIGNFEHMIESHKSDMGRHSSVSLNICQNAQYNWMAPELMKDQPATHASDVYSYSCIIWEMFECEVPWDNCDAEYIKHKVMKENQSLPMEKNKIPLPFKEIALRGLKLTPKARNIDFDQISDWIFSPPNPDPVMNNVMPTLNLGAAESTNNQNIVDLSPDITPRKSPMAMLGVSSVHKKRSVSTGLPMSGDEFSTMSSDHSGSVKLKSRATTMHSHPLKHKQRSHGSTPERYYQESGSDDYNFSDKFYDSPRKANYEDNSGYKLTRFSTGESNWTCEISHRHDGERFGYAADIQKIVNPAEEQMKNLIQNEAEGILRREAELQESRHVSPVYSEKPSMFSYMKLNRNEDIDDRRHGVCKPACHRVSPIPPKTNTFKLSSAGSLYALYNSGTQLEELMRQQMTTSLPQGYRLRDGEQTGTKDDEDVNRRINDNWARRRRYEMYDYEEEKDDHVEDKVWSEADPSWYGGKGSVKNLVNVYQDQVQDHFFQQSVLEGKLSPKSKTNTGFHKKEIDVEPEKEVFNECKLHPRGYVEEESKKTDILCLHSASPTCTVEPAPLDTDCHAQSEMCGACMEVESINSNCSECPGLTIVTTTVVSPEPNLNPETCISVDSVLLDSWINGGLEKIRKQVVRDQAEDVDDERDLCLDIFNDSDETIDDMTKQISKDIELGTWEDKILKKQSLGVDMMCGGDLDRNINIENIDVQDKSFVNVLDVQGQTLDRNDNRGCNENMEDEGKLFINKLDDQKQKETGCEIMDDSYNMLKQDSDGSLLKEVMEELSKSQAKRARQRILHKEYDMKDKKTNEQTGVKLDSSEHERCCHKSLTFPRESSEIGMSNRPEKPTVSQYTMKTQEVEHETRNEMKPRTYPKPTVGSKSTVIPKPKRTKMPRSKGYTTTVTVESSLVRPGEHKLKHVATDLDTGETKTLHEQKVLASSVISTLSAH